MSAMLELDDLSVGYGGVLAVRGVSLSVESGRIATVIGANGAGKSTLLNAIMGILPSRGHIGFGGASLEGLPVETRVGAGLVALDPHFAARGQDEGQSTILPVLGRNPEHRAEGRRGPAQF